MIKDIKIIYIKTHIGPYLPQSVRDIANNIKIDPIDPLKCASIGPYDAHTHCQYLRQGKCVVWTPRVQLRGGYNRCNNCLDLIKAIKITSCDAGCSNFYSNRIGAACITAKGARFLKSVMELSEGDKLQYKNVYRAHKKCPFLEVGNENN